MRRFVTAALFPTVLMACQPVTELTVEQKAEIAAEVELLHSQWVDAWMNADVDRGMAFHRDCPDCAEAVDGQLTKGLAAITEGWRSAFAGVSSQRLSISEVQTLVLAPNVVCINEQATYVVTDTAGVVGPEVPYVYSSIWVREDGEWKINFGHQSSPTTENPQSTNSSS